MSDQTISQVTRAIRALILSRLLAPWRQNPGLPGPRPQVTLLPPGEDPQQGAVGVNLYMYRVNESPYLRNTPYPGDRSGLAPPNPESPLSLEVFYLLTPYAPQPQPTDTEDPSHRMLGEAMLMMHEYPVLNRIHIPGFDSDTELSLALLDSYEDIKVRLNPITIDELSKIWSTIGKPYRLSVAYEVTLVQLTPSRPVTKSAGIVQTTSLDVVTRDAPRITSLQPATGPLAVLTAGNVTPTALTINGFGFVLAGTATSVLVGGSEAPLSPTPPTSTKLVVLMPLDVAGGPDLDVVARLDARAGLPATFKVHPWISFTTPLRTALDANAAADGTLHVSGHGVTGAVEVRGNLGGVIWTAAAADVAGADAITATLPAAADANGSGPGLKNGLHEIRVRMADNSLSNPRKLELIPQLNATSGYPTNSSYNPATRRLTLAGKRLDGLDVRMTVDGTEYVVGPNATGTQLVYNFVRALGAGQHPISVSVDGRQSRGIVLSI